MEIERKFVLQKLPETLPPGVEIIQGYLWFKPETRLRKTNTEHKLTFKSSGALIRKENEININKILFSILWPLTGNNTIKKTRYLIDYEGLELCIDSYNEKLKGLITLECEFQSIEQAELFEPPAWLGPASEVTHDIRFKNKELSKSIKIPGL